VTEKQKDRLDLILGWTLIIVLEVGWVIYLFGCDHPLP
jgi:hypothetical protein